ncbi:hypothetical protein [Undibacterium sp. TJN19]|uniref:hypothetical protein n=1 Tax=Undibacterium sp. TJN19 TaxID=3413055 RepID=UPI003BF448B5
MSGSGGGGGGAPDYVIECDKVFINTQLSSPKPDVIAHISEGDELSIALQSMNGRIVLVAIYDGEIAGGFATPDTAKLRDCIEKGYGFSATVNSINSGQIRVRIHPA